MKHYAIHIIYNDKSISTKYVEGLKAARLFCKPLKLHYNHNMRAFWAFTDRIEYIVKEA